MSGESTAFRLSDYLSSCSEQQRARLEAAVAPALAADDPIPDLVAAYENAGTDTRVALCGVFHAAGDPRAVAALVRDLSAPDADPTLRAAAAAVLGWMDGRGIYAALARALRADPDASVRKEAAQSLGWMRHRRAVPLLTRVLGDEAEVPSVRAQSAEALGVLGDPCAVTALVVALGSDVPEIRYWAAYALGQLHDRRAIPALRSLAASDQAIIPGWVAVADEAADAIRRIEEWPDPAR